MTSTMATVAGSTFEIKTFYEHMRRRRRNRTLLKNSVGIAYFSLRYFTHVAAFLLRFLLDEELRFSFEGRLLPNPGDPG